MKRTLTICPYCGTGCAFYLCSDDDGRLIGVEPSTNHPVSRGQLCIKGWSAFNFVQHPDRLTRPQIRKNGVLRPVSWGEALTAINGKFAEIQKRHGRDSLMFLSSAKATNEENFLMMKLARAVYGTNNVDHCARLCHASTVLGLASTFGSGAMTNSISCFEEADLFFVTGSNTTEQHPLIGARIIESVRKRGAKLIVSDNRRIRLARNADLWMSWKNGTDVLLLNAMMNVIIAEDLYDKKFVTERTENFELLKETVRKYTPDAAADITGIPAVQIIEAARLFARAEKAMIVYSMGITQHTHGVDNVKSCANLAMLTGNVGRPGTGVNPLRGQNNVQGACDVGALPNVFSGYQKVSDEAVLKKFSTAWKTDKLSSNPGLTVTDAIDRAAEGNLKAMYVMGENPVMSDPDQNHVREAMEKIEFLVVQDIFPTDTSEYADVVLPAACFAEKDGTFTSTERRVQRLRKAVEAPGESKADWLILCELAQRAGYEGMAYNSPEEIMDEIAALTPIYGGIDYQRLDYDGLQWPCPNKDHRGTPVLHSGQFSRGKGMFSPAEYKPSKELPDEEYPFTLSTGRCYYHFHTGTMTRRTRLLDREERFPYVELNCEDARKLGIRDRQYINVETRRGKVKTMARVGDTVPAGVLFMPFHFSEAPANLLTNNALDPEAKIPEYKVCAARIWKDQ